MNLIIVAIIKLRHEISKLVCDPYFMEICETITIKYHAGKSSKTYDEVKAQGGNASMAQFKKADGDHDGLPDYDAWVRSRPLAPLFYRSSESASICSGS